MSTVQARDVEPGMVLERLSYSERNRPYYRIATVVEVGDSVHADSESGEACKAILWSDDNAPFTYHPNVRFIRRD